MNQPIYFTKHAQDRILERTKYNLDTLEKDLRENIHQRRQAKGFSNFAILGKRALYIVNEDINGISVITVFERRKSA